MTTTILNKFRSHYKAPPRHVEMELYKGTFCLHVVRIGKDGRVMDMGFLAARNTTWIGEHAPLVKGTLLADKYERANAVLKIAAINLHQDNVPLSGRSCTEIVSLVPAYRAYFDTFQDLNK